MKINKTDQAVTKKSVIYSHAHNSIYIFISLKAEYLN